ncbi:MAG: glycosyltransferase [Candidatus Marinimicrobia bacterium]|nr:glycosyltransferase [Candidatus Neomarinimicrobiota bacterium]
MGRTTLSVCLIVRDEARMLPGCLESVAGVADQLVVVDTGSTDDTTSIARSFGAEVHHFAWIDDFSAARNESIRHATETWILWIDADERLLEHSVEPLRSLLVVPARPTIYQVQIRNLQADRHSYTLSMSHRLFSRHPKIQFSGRIHEQVHPSLKAAGGEEKSSQVILEHEGYALDKAGLKAKFRRNQPLLEAQVAEEPDSGYAHYTLGQNYALMGDPQAALHEYVRAMDLKEFSGASLATVLNAAAEACWQLDRLAEAENYAAESIQLVPRQSSGNFIMYRVMRSREDPAGQIRYLSAVLSQPQEGAVTGGSDLPKDVLIPRQHLLYSLGELQLANEDPASAERVLRECLTLKPDSQQAMTLLTKALAQQGKWEGILQALADLPQPPSSESRGIIGTALIKLQRFPEAVDHYRAWLDDEPDYEGLRERLAGLYAKVGDRAAAESLLRGGSP